MEEKDYLTVGYIISTRGLKGVLRVKSTSYFSQKRYKKGNKLYLYNPKDQTRTEVYANTYSMEGEFDYVSFKDLPDINLVEKYIGCSIQVNKEEIPPLPKNTFYYSDLEGLTCIDEEGKEFGKVKEIIDYTAQPSFKITLKDSDKTIMIPYVEFYCKKVNLENKTITFHLIPGYLE